MTIIIYFYFGSCLASFLLLMVQRIHNHQSFVICRSTCDHCHTVLSIRQLLPIFSYLRQIKKACPCGYKLPRHYLITEIIGGVITTMIIFYIPLNCFTVVLFLSTFFQSLYDYLYLKLQPTIYYLTASILIIHYFFHSDSLLGLVFAMSSYLLLTGINLVLGQVIGQGDIKLLTLWAFLLPFNQFILIIFWASILGILFMTCFQVNRPIPFVPFLATGLLVSYL